MISSIAFPEVTAFDAIYDAAGTLLRTHAGADYHHPPTANNATRNNAFVGVWDVADATASHATAVGAVLFGTTKGYIHPYYVRTITGWHRDGQTGRIWWETIPRSLRSLEAGCGCR